MLGVNEGGILRRMAASLTSLTRFVCPYNEI